MENSFNDFTKILSMNDNGSSLSSVLSNPKKCRTKADHKNSNKDDLVQILTEPGHNHALDKFMLTQLKKETKKRQRKKKVEKVTPVLFIPGKDNSSILTIDQNLFRSLIGAGNLNDKPRQSRSTKRENFSQTNFMTCNSKLPQADHVTFVQEVEAIETKGDKSPKHAIVECQICNVKFESRSRLAIHSRVHRRSINNGIRRSRKHLQNASTYDKPVPENCVPTRTTERSPAIQVHGNRSVITIEGKSVTANIGSNLEKSKRAENEKTVLYDSHSHTVRNTKVENCIAESVSTNSHFLKNKFVRTVNYPAVTTSSLESFSASITSTESLVSKEKIFSTPPVAVQENSIRSSFIKPEIHNILLMEKLDICGSGSPCKTRQVWDKHRNLEPVYNSVTPFSEKKNLYERNKDKRPVTSATNHDVTNIQDTSLRVRSSSLSNEENYCSDTCTSEVSNDGEYENYPSLTSGKLSIEENRISRSLQEKSRVVSINGISEKNYSVKYCPSESSENSTLTLENSDKPVECSKYAGQCKFSGTKKTFYTSKLERNETGSNETSEIKRIKKVSEMECTLNTADGENTENNLDCKSHGPENQKENSQEGHVIDLDEQNSLKEQSIKNIDLTNSEIVENVTDEENYSNRKNTDRNHDDSTLCLRELEHNALTVLKKLFAQGSKIKDDVSTEKPKLGTDDFSDSKPKTQLRRKDPSQMMTKTHSKGDKSDNFTSVSSGRGDNLGKLLDINQPSPCTQMINFVRKIEDVCKDRKQTKSVPSVREPQSETNRGDKQISVLANIQSYIDDFSCITPTKYCGISLECSKKDATPRVQNGELWNESTKNACSRTLSYQVNMRNYNSWKKQLVYSDKCKTVNSFEDRKVELHADDHVLNSDNQDFDYDNHVFDPKNHVTDSDTHDFQSRITYSEKRQENIVNCTVNIPESKKETEISPCSGLDNSFKEKDLGHETEIYDTETDIFTDGSVDQTPNTPCNTDHNDTDNFTRYRILRNEFEEKSLSNIKCANRISEDDTNSSAVDIVGNFSTKDYEQECSHDPLESVGSLNNMKLESVTKGDKLDVKKDRGDNHVSGSPVASVVRSLFHKFRQSTNSSDFDEIECNIYGKIMKRHEKQNCEDFSDLATGNESDSSVCSMETDEQTMSDRKYNMSLLGKCSRLCSFKENMERIHYQNLNIWEIETDSCDENVVSTKGQNEIQEKSLKRKKGRVPADQKNLQRSLDKGDNNQEKGNNNILRRSPRKKSSSQCRDIKKNKNQSLEKNCSPLREEVESKEKLVRKSPRKHSCKRTCNLHCCSCEKNGSDKKNCENLLTFRQKTKINKSPMKNKEVDKLNIKCKDKPCDGKFKFGKVLLSKTKTNSENTSCRKINEKLVTIIKADDNKGRRKQEVNNQTKRGKKMKLKREKLNVKLFGKMFVKRRKEVITEAKFGTLSTKNGRFMNKDENCFTGKKSKKIIFETEKSHLRSKIGKNKVSDQTAGKRYTKNPEDNKSIDILERSPNLNRDKPDKGLELNRVACVENSPKKRWKALFQNETVEQIDQVIVYSSNSSHFQKNENLKDKKINIISERDQDEGGYSSDVNFIDVSQGSFSSILDIENKIDTDDVCSHLSQSENSDIDSDSEKSLSEEGFTCARFIQISKVMNSCRTLPIGEQI